MNKNELGIIIAVVVIGGGVAAAYASGAFNVGPKLPNVKFVDFSPQNQVTIKQGQTTQIKFNIINNEPTSVSGISVTTTEDSFAQFFGIDKPTITIAGQIGANGGRSGEQTVTITGLENSLNAVEEDFTVSLLVGSDVTDSKVVKVRLEK